MSLREFFSRLRRLERQATTTATDFATDLAERQKFLAVLCHDSEALTLYHQYLESLSRTCVHESIGSCASCWKTRLNSSEAQHALRQFEDRICVLEQQPPTTEGEQS